MILLLWPDPKRTTKKFKARYTQPILFLNSFTFNFFNFRKNISENINKTEKSKKIN